jgi:hypothetical protein
MGWILAEFRPCLDYHGFIIGDSRVPPFLDIYSLPVRIESVGKADPSMMVERNPVVFKEHLRESRDWFLRGWVSFRAGS